MSWIVPGSPDSPYGLSLTDFQGPQPCSLDHQQMNYFSYWVPPCLPWGRLTITQLPRPPQSTSQPYPTSQTAGPARILGQRKAPRAQILRGRPLSGLCWCHLKCCALSASPQSWLGAGLATDKGMGGGKEVKRRVEGRVLRGQGGKSEVNRRADTHGHRRPRAGLQNATP